jgi:NADH dehydrogenase FAD-containing subunit
MPNHDESKDSQRVVIVGASFGALSAAAALAWPQFQVTQAQYDLFEPLLYQVATGARQAYFRPPRLGCPW